MANIRAVRNPLTDTDSYKFSHFLQYPPEITNVSSYIEARSGDDWIVFFGLQMWLKDYLSKPIMMDDVADAELLMKQHGEPFNTRGFTSLIGKPWPVKIQAVAEGTPVAPGNVLVQLSNTDPELPWVTSFLETSLLRAIWYPSTVATNSRKIKRLIKRYLDDTGNPDLLPFKLHDFGFRGVSSRESGCIGGLAHLVNFMGSDTVGALEYGRRFYREPCAGFSIPAAEHSTIMAWTQAGEVNAYDNMIKQFSKKGSIYAVVSDTYDIFAACDKLWGGILRDKIVAAGGTLVIRPDSGDPVDTTLKVLNILVNRFGTKTNDKGFKVLPDYLRIIWGDGVNYSSISEILYGLKDAGWSADNIAFGMGGALLQDVTRDDFSFAMKANAVSVDGGAKWMPISKNPVTSSGKKSKAGRLGLIREEEWKTVPEASIEDPRSNYLKTVWEDGRLLIETTLKEVRERAAV